MINGSTNRKAACESLEKSDRGKVLIISFPRVFGPKVSVSELIIFQMKYGRIIDASRLFPTAKSKRFCVVVIEKYFHRHEREGGEALQLVLPQWGA